VERVGFDRFLFGKDPLEDEQVRVDGLDEHPDSCHTFLNDPG
jgi:hypothetical protein